MGTTNENLNFDIQIQRVNMWPSRLVLAQNGLRSSPRKSISNSTDWCRRHKNVTNVSLSRCVSFYYWAIESEQQFHIYTQESWFFLAFGGKELTKEQGHLGSLCASLYRLHCHQSPIEANLKDRRRKTKQAPFLDTSPALKTQKPRLHRLEQRNRC